MATAAQLRAALAALDIDPRAVESQVADQSPATTAAGDDRDGIERAMLAGLLLRTMLGQLRQVIAQSPDTAEFSARLLACSPQSIEVEGEDVAANADFLAHWLDDYISRLIEQELGPDGLAGMPQVPTVLGAAASAALAIKTLFELRRDPMPAKASPGYSTVMIRMAMQHLDTALDYAGHAATGVEVIGPLD